MPKARPMIFIVGPTAVGKTDVALGLAAQIDAEIISCDAMQVYKGLPIASNQPDKAELKRCPHHLLGVVPLSEEFDVAAFNQMATEAIEGIWKKGRTPLVVGGSGMYIQVLLDGIFEGPSKDPELRQRLEQRIAGEGAAVLHQELSQVDPDAAKKIHSNDARRIVRALEVHHTTRQPISRLQKSRRGFWEKADVSVFVLNRPRQELYDRINDRVEQMFERGLIDEIKKIRKKPLSSTARSMIGVDEVLGYLDGTYDLECAREQMKQRSRRLAKRQLTWFRKDQRFRWVMVTHKEKVEDVILRIQAELK